MCVDTLGNETNNVLWVTCIMYSQACVVPAWFTKWIFFSCWIQSLDFCCFSGTQNDEELLSCWVGNSSHDILLLSTLVCSSIQFHFVGLHHFLYSFANVTQSYINSSFLQLIKKQPWIKKRPNFCKAPCNLTYVHNTRDQSLEARPGFFLIFVSVS